MTTLLIADDDAAIRSAVRLALTGEGYQIAEAASLEAAEDALRAGAFELMLLDVHFGEGKTCHELVKRLAEAALLPPTVVLSGAATAKEAADAIRFGAYDYVEKPPTAERLRIALRRCLDHARLQRAYTSMTTRVSRLGELVGASPGMREVKKLIEQFGPKDVKVLITGETGTGKEEVAHALYRLSSRCGKPFIIVNGAAIPESLVESELFGHKRGSFTGATSDQIGKIEMADGGTLFLDELGELTAAAQSKLLRFLENGEIQPVGANKQKRCDVRFLAATSRDLEGEIKKGRFREDLYYRLNVAHIEVPPLRDRRDDVVTLFRHFVASFCKKYGEADKPLAEDAAALLARHDWPGNVRELRNVAERAVITAADEITVADLPRLAPAATVESGDGAIVPFKEFKKRSEAAYIAKALAATGGSVAKAAELLQLDRSHCHQKITQLGVSVSDGRSR